MRVLCVSQYFPPELSGGAIRAACFVELLRQRGDQVTVITEFPNHPRGVLAPEHRGRWLERRSTADGEIVRVWVRTASTKTFSTRMAFYLSFMTGAVAAGLWATRDRFDVIWASSPPLFVAAGALVLSRVRRVPLVIDIGDLWPESAVALGELRHPGAIRLAEWLEHRCYRRASQLVVASEGMRARLITRGVPAGKVTVIVNGADTQVFAPRPAPAALRARLGLDGAVVVLYAGLHGLAQRLEVVLEAAALLRDRPEIRFLLVGEGPQREALAAQARARDLRNVVLHAGVPPRDMPPLFALAQMALVPLRKHPVFARVLPVKLFEAWACGCPTVAGIDGEVRALTQAADAGVCVEPEDAAALAAAIARLAADPDLCRRLGANGRRYVEAHGSRQVQARVLDTVLARVGE